MTLMFDSGVILKGEIRSYSLSGIKGLRALCRIVHDKKFTILKKCCGKFECSIYFTLFIQEKKPKQNSLTQNDGVLH